MPAIFLLFCWSYGEFRLTCGIAGVFEGDRGIYFWGGGSVLGSRGLGECVGLLASTEVQFEVDIPDTCQLN